MIIYDKSKINAKINFGSHLENYKNIKLVYSEYILWNKNENIFNKWIEKTSFMNFDETQIILEKMLREVNKTNLNFKKVSDLYLYKVDLYSLEYDQTKIYYINNIQIKRINNYNNKKKFDNILLTIVRDFKSIVKIMDNILDKSYNIINKKTQLFPSNKTIVKELEFIKNKEKENKIKKLIQHKLASKINQNKIEIFQTYKNILNNKTSIKKLLTKENNLLEKLNNLDFKFTSKLKEINRKIRNLQQINYEKYENLGIFSNYNNYHINIFNW